ncbi:hypothetical protein [Sinimarinibacterium flocculans]|uniref:hypothetical protein n=1 Tax=Sinimarinibacterium flocculans TaxID=985250 RepID=UPI0024928317|nr:hypothetical protein [Sinimarinibacterium flocculans]
MEQALKDLVAGNLDLQYSPDDTGDEEDEEDAAANEDAEKNGDEDGGWTNNRLMHFFNVYRSLAFAHQKYLKQLSPSLHSAFSPFILPQLRDEVFWRASSFSRIAAEAQRRWRKSRTDSLFPRFGEIRTICEFRTNQADRIRTAFDSLVTKAAHNDLELPHRFTITEPASPFGPATDHKFTLWSRLSIGKAYRSAGRWTNENSRNHRGMANDYFLEYDGGQVIGAVSPTPDLWFADLLRYNLCHKDSIRTKATYDVLRSYGIPRNQYNKLSATLSGGRGLSAAFHDLIREVRAIDSSFHPVYFHPHGLYTICLAGRLAVRIICVTTCRANELQQIFAGEDCLLKVDLTTLNRPAFAFMAIPKLRNEPEPFFIDERCLKFLREQLQWIALNSPNGVVPAIVGGKNLARHKRQHPRPYAFQFPRERPVAMRAGTIGSVVRFMLHGMMFRTTEGKPFQPGLHDLRHVTAAAYRSQDVPLPIIAKMMKQKDFRVTDYYSEPTSTQVVSAMQGLQVATVGNGAPDGVRMPDELERQLAEADGKVGALSNVLGGKCGCGTECAARFACLGCGAHIPDHREEDKVREIRSRRLSDRDFYASLGALAEVRKCESDIRDCDRVLEEMRLQKLAEADSKRTPDIKSLSEAPVRFWPKGTT